MAALSVSTAESSARHLHAAVGLGSHMFVWGGRGGRGSLVSSSVVERFNVPSISWQDRGQFRGQSLPDGLYGMAVVSDGDKAYCFGGFADRRSQLHNALYVLDLSSMQCREIAAGTESPTARVHSAMVYYRRQLVLYGGLTGSTSDELFVFDLHTNTWTAQATTGEKPPALYGHTLTRIDGHRSVVFGGCDGNFMFCNDTYILDMKTWNWSKLQTNGTKPPARFFHTTCCVGGQLMVVGGYGYPVFSDVWLLNVTSGSWSEVTLPTDITQRQGHSAVVFGTGPDYRAIVFFGGNTSVLSSDVISETTLFLLSQKKGSWVVERVVGSGELRAPDDSLQEQINRLQFTRPHHHYDPQFPGVCFLGEPAVQEVPVQSEPVTIAPPGLGVYLKVPPGAVPPDADKPVNVTVQACLSGSTFKYPEGCTPLSAVYHISADSPFDKEVELTFEHFAELETENDVSQMTFFRAESIPTVTEGGKEFIFTPIEGGQFEVGGSHCTLSTKTFCKMCVGTKQACEIRNRYAVLCSYSNDVHDVGHAAIAVCLDDAVYMTNFRKALENEWKVPLSHRCRLNVSFREAEAEASVGYPEEGWNIVCDPPHRNLSEDDVNYSKPESLTLYDYPPRVILEMKSVNSEQCTFQLGLTGMTKEVAFEFPVRVRKQSLCIPHGASERPTLMDLMCLSRRDRKSIYIIEESATSYRRIGTLLLNDRRGKRVDIIESDEGEKAEKIITEIYKKWMAEDKNYSWTTLTECFRECRLKTLANDIEQYFGITSPQKSEEEPQSRSICICC